MIPPDVSRHVVRRATDVLGVLVVLARVRSCLAGGVATGIGGYLATGRILAEPAVGILAAAGIAVMIAFANVVNDIVDVDVDAVGKPDRPIPAGRLSRSASWRFASGLAIAAVIVTAPLGPPMVGGTAVLLIASFLYSVRLKNTVLLGNIVVAACASSPLMFGAAAVGRINSEVWVATVLAFEFMLSYEVLKTMADRTGDAAVGLRTVATATRSRTSRRVFVAVVVALTATALAATVLCSHPVRYLAFAVPVLTAPGCFVVYRLRTAVRDEQMWDLMRVMRRAWLFGMVALWMLR
jgi:4-hydroxybenzoate polyprenyltransferase